MRKCDDMRDNEDVQQEAQIAKELARQFDPENPEVQASQGQFLEISRSQGQFWLQTCFLRVVLGQNYLASKELGDECCLTQDIVIEPCSRQVVGRQQVGSRQIAGRYNVSISQKINVLIKICEYIHQYTQNLTPDTTLMVKAIKNSILINFNKKNMISYENRSKMSI